MAVVLLGAHPVVLASAVLAALLVPILPSNRPPTSGLRAATSRLVVAIVLLAGAAQGGAHLRGTGRDCRLNLPDGMALDVEGVVLTEPRWGRTVVEVGTGLPGDCRVPLRVRLNGADPGPPGGSVRIAGTWRVNHGAFLPDYAGEIEAGLAEPRDGTGVGGLVGWRVGVARRVEEIFPRHASLVSALVLARKDGLDTEVRESFARSGTAHLLAISGFHVAVVAGLLLASLRSLGVGRRGATVVSALGVWAYVAFIGAPDAAVRAAVLLSCVAMGRCLGRPIHAGGVLATAFVALLAIDPGGLMRPGFQLSFAGALGLVVGAQRLESALERWIPGGAWASLRSALGAGVAATLATMPIVAWHFDQVSLVGVPATLAGTPLVAAAIPGIFVAFLLDLVLPSAGVFLAGGVEGLLDVLVLVMDTASSLPFAVAHPNRATLLTAGTGVAVARVVSLGDRPVRTAYRIASLASGAGVALLMTPVLSSVTSSGSVEVRILDVGQGDAIAVRSATGRWILVDTGPGGPGRASDPFASAVVRSLRRAGIRRLDFVVLTHPDLDHIGGAGPILETLDVAVIGDPGRGRGTEPYLDALRFAHSEPATWHRLTRGDRFEIDGMTLDVLHPSATTPPDVDPNDASVVLLLRFGLFTALLTGDAPAHVEEAIGKEVGPIDLLKVGHHGSRTSSSSAFLESVRPSISVISVGRNNRYGHPHPEVEERILRYSSLTFRTDRDGAVQVIARRDGTWETAAERGENP